jgi:chemotaxis protein histidine kinase CheA
MTGELDEVWERFTLDGQEALSAIEQGLLRLEAVRDDGAELNRLYRGLHTLKGNSGFMGLAQLERLAHACEDLIGLFRDEGVAFDDQSVEVVLEAVDVLRELVREASSARQDVDAARVDPMFQRLHARLEELGGRSKREGSSQNVSPVELAPVDPADDVGFLEIFLPLAADTLKAISGELAALLLDRTDAHVSVLLEKCDELSLACERMGFVTLVDACSRLVAAVKAHASSDDLTELELELHAQVLAVKRRYQTLSAEPLT